MLETWRWFDQDDAVSLKEITEAGATDIVSSLNEFATGDVWPLEAIISRKDFIENASLKWSVVESLHVHNDIKTRSGNYQRLIDNYKQSIINLGKAGIGTVCYNFMPVVDWTRTNLDYHLENTGCALRFDMIDFIAYDIYVLGRQDAEKNYTEDMVKQAKQHFDALSQQQIDLLENNIIAGLPGGEGSYSQESLKQAIAEFINLGEDGLRSNLIAFLSEITPIAEKAGVNLCIHPDDPPFSLFGLPRVVSTQDDVRRILYSVDSSANGLTLCAGSFGARGDNNLIAMVEEFGSRIYFAHLRNVVREENGSFYEAEHLNGDNDMVGLISALLEEEEKRKARGYDLPIPMRPDHGHLLAYEMNQENVKPGYSYIGRLKGLAELRGVIHGLSYAKK